MGTRLTGALVALIGAATGCSLIVDATGLAGSSADASQATIDGATAPVSGDGSLVDASDAPATSDADQGEASPPDAAKAIVITNLTHGSSMTDGTSHETASLATSASDLVVIDVFSTLVAAGTAQPPTAISGAGMSFSKLADISAGSGTWSNLSRWYARAPAAATGILTIGYASPMDAVIWSVNRIDNCRKAAANGSDAFSQTVSRYDDTGTAQSVTLGPFVDARNGTFAVFMALKSTSAGPLLSTPKSGYVRLSHDDADASGDVFSMMVQWTPTSDPAPSVSWSAPLKSARGLASEVAVE